MCGTSPSPARPTVPLALPVGRYGARVTMGRRVETTEVELRRNPRIERERDEDLAAEYESGALVRNEVDRANRAVIAIQDLKAHLTATDDDETLIAVAKLRRTAASAADGEIYQMQNRSNRDALNLPDHGEQPTGQPAVDVGAGGWEAGRGDGGVVWFDGGGVEGGDA